jgi:hypothetical protein
MDFIVLLTAIVLLLPAFWVLSHFNYRILDAFSSVRKEYGIISEKEYIIPRTKIVTKRVYRSHEDFNATISEIPKEIQVPEKFIFHIKLNGRIIATPVPENLYESMNQGDSICVKYSQGRFSKNIYIKKVACS